MVRTRDASVTVQYNSRMSCVYVGRWRIGYGGGRGKRSGGGKKGGAGKDVEEMARDAIHGSIGGPYGFVR